MRRDLSSDWAGSGLERGRWKAGAAKRTSASGTCPHARAALQRSGRSSCQFGKKKRRVESGRPPSRLLSEPLAVTSVGELGITLQVVTILTANSYHRLADWPLASSTKLAPHSVVVERGAAGLRLAVLRVRPLPRRRWLATPLRATQCSFTVLANTAERPRRQWRVPAAAATAAAGAGGCGDDRSGGAGVSLTRAAPSRAAHRRRRWLRRRRRWRPPPPSRARRRRRVADMDWEAGGSGRCPPARAGWVGGGGLCTESRAGGEG